MCWQRGYLHQELSNDGTQRYSNITLEPAKFMKKLPEKIIVTIEGHDVHIGAWQYDITSGDHTVPVYFLDTNIPENTGTDRDITRDLYGGDGAMRLLQAEGLPLDIRWLEHTPYRQYLGKTIAIDPEMPVIADLKRNDLEILHRRAR
jgi:hypothetical protein